MRGILFGLSLHHSQAHVIRSLIEGICYRLFSVIQPLEGLTGKSTEIRKLLIDEQFGVLCC